LWIPFNFAGLILAKAHPHRGLDCASALPHQTQSYSKGGREENIRNANAIATYLDKKSKPHGHVVVSLVNPYASLRGELKRNNKDQVMEVLLKSNRDLRKDYHVEDFEAGHPNYIISTDDEKTEDTWNKLKELLNV
jgi:hypothetical protein